MVEQPINHQDIITYKPQILEIYSRDLIAVYKENHTIINGLKKENELLYLTVKEIHEFYRDEEGRYSKSLKTVYRYLEKLKEVGYIVEGGRRVTENKRNTEFLYCLKGELIFFEDEPEGERWWNRDDGLNDFLSKVSPLIASQLDDKKLDDPILKSFLASFYKEKDKIVDEIVMSAEQNQKIADVYRAISTSKINYFNDTAALLVILMKHPDIFVPICNALDNSKG
jgi:Fe2+ or Zn2+ uptake regulation protein